MKKKYFDEAKQWEEKDVNFLGLPRPWAIPKRKDLAKKVPIPWQSEDRFDSLGHLGLNQNNENMVYEKNLCSYCGIEIKNKESVIRWITAPLATTLKEGPRVFSDFHPLHLECMKQARTFCPHMRKLQDLDFETGKFEKLKQNAINDVIKARELNGFIFTYQKIIEENVQP